MRQFISLTMPENGAVRALGDDYRHLRRVLRVRVGDMMDVRLPDGRLAPFTVCKIDDSKCAITMQECAANPNKGTVDPLPEATDGNGRNNRYLSPVITLFQFIARPQKMEVIVRQAVECAVDTIVPVAGEYSQAGYVECLKNGPTARMQRIIREAMEQSGAKSTITVTKAMRLEDAIKWWQENKCSAKNNTDATKIKTIALVLSERDAVPPYDAINDCRLLKERNSEKQESAIQAAIAVGSEGGISVAEEEQLKNAGFRSVHFNCNIMRCETAALYGAAVVREMLP